MPRIDLRFVDEQERHETFPAFLARRRKNFAHHSLRFAHPHVQDLRAFDVHEILVHFRAGFFPELFREIVGGRFADERLAATRWAVEQETLGGRVLEFLEKIGVQQAAARSRP